MVDTAESASTPETGSAAEATTGNSLWDDLASAYTEMESRDETPDTEEGGSQEPDTEEETETSEQAEESESPASETESTDEDDDVDIPQNLNAKTKQWISTLDKEGQRVAVERLKDLERGYTKKFEKISSREKQLSGLEQAIEPYREQWAREGVDEGLMVKQLIAANNFLTTQPVEGIKWLAQQMGVDLQKVAQPEQSEDQYKDPQIASLEAEIRNLKQHLEQSQQVEAQERQQTVLGQIQAFASETDADGNLLRPYFEDVREEMSILMRSGKAETLDEAYDAAVWAKKTTREKLLEDQMKAQDAARKERLGKAKKTREPRSTAATGKSERPKSLEEMLNEEWDRMAS